MKYFGLLLLSLFVIGCQDQPDKNNLFFGGEIINPKSNVVLLMQHEKVIDSLFIALDNTFGKRIADVKPGLYYFKHAYEFQYLYLEPKDSIRIRLNTWDFDETLVFDGLGSEKNELLLDLFLINEKEADIFYTYFSLDEKSFETKINDALKRHSNYLEQLKETNQKLSKNFLHLAQGAINYPIYRLKELYPFYHKKSLVKDSVFKLSKNYYDFRKNIDLNDSLLAGYYAYQNYISAHLYNVALQKSHNNKFDTKFRDTLIHLITEKIELPELKNRLIYQEVLNMLFGGSSDINKDQLQTFYNNSTDSIAISTIKSIVEAKQKMQIGAEISDFELQSPQKEMHSLKEVIQDKNAVIYFLPPTFVSNDYLHKRVKYLIKKYPEVNFVGIYANVPNKHQPIMRKLANQYFLADNTRSDDLFSEKYPRAILVNTKGKVVTNYTLLTNKNIDSQIVNLINSATTTKE